jgi:hypothetical protein
MIGVARKDNSCIPMTQMVYEAFLQQKELNFMLGNYSENGVFFYT